MLIVLILKSFYFFYALRHPSAEVRKRLLVCQVNFRAYVVEYLHCCVGCFVRYILVG